MSEKKPEPVSESESTKLGSEEVSREFKTLVSSDDLRSLNHLQHTILGRLQDSNAVLSHFNDFSQQCFAEISGEMGKNTRQLKSIKSDLDYIFQKLRSMKTKILTTYPDAFPEDSMTEVIDRRPDLEMPNAQRKAVTHRPNVKIVIAGKTTGALAWTSRASVSSARVTKKQKTTSVSIQVDKFLIHV